MGKLIIVLFFLLAVIIGKSIFIKLMKRMMNSAAVDGINFSPVSEKFAEIWKESGNSRCFENADYKIAKEDFFDNEKTELPSFEDAIDGLSESEAEEIMRIAGISGREEDKTFE